MIDGLKPYSAMKNSGVLWLGEVPAHWDVRRLKHVCRLTYGDALTSGARQEGEVPVYGSNGRVGCHSIPNTHAPCIVIGRKGSFGKVNFSAEPVFAIDTTYYVDPRTSSADIRWLYYLLGWLRLDDVSKDSAIPGLDREDAYKGLAPVPPLPEQAAIVRFLDHADRRIRRYIRAKQKLIKLLEEQKRVIIHRAVTGQIDVRTGRPYPAYKPSGVEWLGDVPEHWAVQRLGRVSKVFNGATPSRMQPAYWEDGSVPWLSSGKVNEWVVESPSELVSERAMRECSLSLVPSGAVIVGLVGQGRTRGKSALLGMDACINQNLAAIVPCRDIPGTYLLYFLTAFYRTFREFGRGGNQEALNCEIVASWRIPVPASSEQRAICNHLNDCLAEGRSAERRIAQEIALLREFRTRLIADVVTGKLDVREATARLPDEVVEPEPLDEPSGDTGAVEVTADEPDEVLEEFEA